MMPIGEHEIRVLMRERNWNQTELANALGVKQPTVSRWLAGTMPDPPQQEKIADLIAGRLESPRAAAFTEPPDFLGERDFPVYAAAEGGPGEMVVYTDPIDMVPRPWYMGRVKEGYGVLVVGDSMDPAFRPGEIAIVNPRLVAQPSTDVILVSETEHGEFKASIKYLIKQEPHRWYLRQYNPPEGEQRDFWRDKKDWQRAVRVVGKYAGR